MKKAFFFGIAALLALAVFSCGDIIPQAVSNVVGYTADGREIVELDLGAGINNARALHPTLAAAASDFYEVVFYDNASTSLYRTSWREGRTVRLRLPTGNYDSSPNYAYIFAGRYDDLMLLGVGTIANHYESTAPTVAVSGGTVTANTVKIDFLIEALTTNVTKVDTTSTFKTGKWAAGVFTANTVSDSNWQVETIKVSDEEIPVFMLPANNTGNDAAAFDITCTTTTLLENIVYAGAATYISKPYAWIDSIDDLPINLAGVTFLDTMTANAQVTLPIHLQITTSSNNSKGKGGLCLLGIEVPVYLKSNAAAVNGAVAKIWKLKGGLNNSLLDMGYLNTGMGGAVLIGSGNVLGGNGIEFDGKY